MIRFCPPFAHVLSYSLGGNGHRPLSEASKIGFGGALDTFGPPTCGIPIMREACTGDRESLRLDLFGKSNWSLTFDLQTARYSDDMFHRGFLRSPPRMSRRIHMHIPTPCTNPTPQESAMSFNKADGSEVISTPRGVVGKMSHDGAPPPWLNISGSSRVQRLREVR